MNLGQIRLIIPTISKFESPSYSTPSYFTGLWSNSFIRRQGVRMLYVLLNCMVIFKFSLFEFITKLCYMTI